MKHLILILSLTFTICASAQQTGSSRCRLPSFVPEPLIDGKSNAPRRDQVIVIRGNHIESVADAANAKIPAGATVIDLSNRPCCPA